MSDVEADHEPPPQPHRPRLRLPDDRMNIREDSYESMSASETAPYLESRLIRSTRSSHSYLSPREEYDLLRHAKKAVAGYRRLCCLFVFLLFFNLALVAAYILTHPMVTPLVFGPQEQKGDPLPTTSVEDTATAKAEPVKGQPETSTTATITPPPPSRHREGVAFLESVNCSNPSSKDLCWQKGRKDENFIFGLEIINSSKIEVQTAGHYFIFCKATVSGSTPSLTLQLSKQGVLKRQASFSNTFADLFLLEYLDKRDCISVALSESQIVDKVNTYIGIFKFD